MPSLCSVKAQNYPHPALAVREVVTAALEGFRIALSSMLRKAEVYSIIVTRVEQSPCELEMLGRGQVGKAMDFESMYRTFESCRPSLDVVKP